LPGPGDIGYAGVAASRIPDPSAENSIMPASPSDRLSRRRFLQRTAAASAAAVAAPAIVTAAKTDSAPPVVGVGDYQYEVLHDWAQLPSRYTWQTTHNVAVGSDGTVYVIHEGRLDQKEHPSIFAFDADGKFQRAFGEEFQGGGHGLEVRTENGEDALYVCAYQQQRSFAKLTAVGDEIWRKGAPMESGVYVEGEDNYPRAADDNPWGRDRFHPTNIAFHPDGGFYLIDGYGAYRIHYFDDQDRWVSTFGQPGTETKVDGTFRLPHGIWIDDRGGEDFKIVVADRVNGRLQWFDQLGQHVQTLDGFLLPANIDIQGDTMIVPDLFGRVTLLDGENRVIAQLGDDAERIQADTKFSIRGDESKWLPGKFIHPHDACFDSEGNIYVAEWVNRGRVTKLRRRA
jgi:hypothetical protein